MSKNDNRFGMIVLGIYVPVKYHNFNKGILIGHNKSGSRIWQIGGIND
jgi:hypothetical protein